MSFSLPLCDQIFDLFSRNLGWMAWNLVLALIPLLTGRRSRSILWWLGAIARRRTPPLPNKSRSRLKNF